MKRMLVNATQQEELRVAMVDGQRLFDLDVEVPSREQRKANIYKGRITRIEPSLEAAFVDFGADRHGFLPLKEISSEYFVRKPEEGGRVNIKDVLKEAQEIVIQVDKEERGTKGAALTTFVSLAGRFLVLMPNNPRAGGVSRRITGEDRDIVREALDALKPPDSMGCIVRTAGVGRSEEELRWDLDYLLSVWERIKEVVVTRPAPFLIYQEGNAIVRAIRDHLTSEIGEILVDDTALYEQAHEFMAGVMPHNLKKLKIYDDDTVPLFTRFQIESQIESAYSHTVSLPSGGSIVIDPTEALTSIDINSARATKGEDIEETALNTNLEAADEIARQLRIRDVGGLIVIDFIDMGPQRNQRDVEDRLRAAVRQDRARIQIGRISRFGLLEMSRQRLRPSLGEATQAICPRCHGLGNIRSIESLALAVLRLIGEEARKERSAKVIAQLPIDVCNFVLNEKRDWVQSIQDGNRVSVVLVANPDLVTPNYSIKRIRDDEADLPENSASSYQMAEQKTEPAAAYEQPSKAAPAAEQPAVAGIVPATPAPTPPQRPARKRDDGDTVSLWRRLFGWLLSDKEPAKSARQPQPRKTRSRNGNRRNDGRRRSQSKDRSGSRDRSGTSGSGTGNGGSSGRGRSGSRKAKSSRDSTGGDGGSSRGRRSRRRGGRGGGGGGGGGGDTRPSAKDAPEKTEGRDNSKQSAKNDANGSSREQTGSQAQGADTQVANSPRADSRRPETAQGAEVAPRKPVQAEANEKANVATPNDSERRNDSEPKPATSVPAASVSKTTGENDGAKTAQAAPPSQPAPDTKDKSKPAQESTPPDSQSS